MLSKQSDLIAERLKKLAKGGALDQVVLFKRPPANLESVDYALLQFPPLVC